jgi:hypothetical protein
VTYLDKDLFTDVTEGERHEADLVVKARFCGEPAACWNHWGEWAWNIQHGGVLSR